METINVKIDVNVEFGPKATAFLEALLRPQPAHCCCAHDNPEEPIDISDPEPDQDMPDFAPKPQPQPEPKEITDADLRQAVKAAKDRVGAKPIREVFSAMGITSSVECPQERRSELVAKLNELK